MWQSYNDHITVYCNKQTQLSYSSVLPLLFCDFWTSVVFLGLTFSPQGHIITNPSKCRSSYEYREEQKMLPPLLQMQSWSEEHGKRGRCAFPESTLFLSCLLVWKDWNTLTLFPLLDSFIYPALLLCMQKLFRVQLRLE